MNSARHRVLAVALLLPTLLLGRCGAQTQPSIQVDIKNPALAERMIILSRGALRATSVVEDSWRVSANLIRAAIQLNPDDPHYHRLLSDALLRTGDNDEAIKELRYYVGEVGSDEHGQVRLMELELGRKETADAKLKYLQSLVSSKLSPAVRSHAALLAAQTLFERSQPTKALEMIDEALALNPLNLEALRVKHDMLPQDAPQEQRLTLLLDMMRANPSQPEIVARIAKQLADAGLVGPSMQWYSMGFNLYPRMALTPDSDFLINCAIELFLAEDIRAAESLSNQLVQMDPTNTEGWLVRLVVTRAMDNKEVHDQAIAQALAAMSNRLATVRQSMPDSTATTQPIEGEVVQLPDPAPDVAALKKLSRQDLTDQYVSAANAIAWIRIYFEKNAAGAAPWIGAVKSLDPGATTRITRLEGWSLLIQDRKDEARVKLSAVSDHDALAAMGMLRFVAPDSGVAQQEASKLLRGNPSGVIGMMLANELRSYGARVSPGPDSAAVAEALEKFPQNWLQILDQPRRFYSVRLEPEKVAHAFGEPLVVKVTIQNMSDQDLVIDKQGVIHPDLWFDAQLRGAMQEKFPSIAYDRVVGPLVLKARQGTTQIMRVDQSDLGALLAANPVTTLQVMLHVTTNPISSNGTVSYSPGGDKWTMPTLLERIGSPVNSPEVRQRASETLVLGDAPSKIRALELLATYAQGLNNPDADEQTRMAGAQFREAVRRAMNDVNPSVRAWSAYLSALLTPQAERPVFLDRMARDDNWLTRLFAGVVVQGTGQSRNVLNRLARDQDELVRNYAESVRGMLAAGTPTVTQALPAVPATQPLGSSQ